MRISIKKITDNEELKQRVLRIGKIVFYTLSAIALPLVTLFLVAMAQGYYYNIETGEVSTKGLVVFDSLPGNAEISINGDSTNKSTAHRFLLKTGDYVARLTKEGYRPWTKTIYAEPSEVTWVEYPQLVLNNISSSIIKETPNLSIVKTSPDKKFSAYSYAKDGIFYIETVNLDTVKDKVIFTSSVKKSLVATDIVWSKDSQRLLVHVSGDITGYLLVDIADPKNTIYLSEKFPFKFDNVSFDPRDWHQLFWLNDGQLNKLDISQKEPVIIARNVRSFSVNEDNIYYVKDTDLYRLERDNTAKKLISGLSKTDSYDTSHFKYEGVDYLLVHDISSKEAKLYQDYESSSTEQNEILLNMSTAKVSVSPSGQFLLLEGNKDMATFNVKSKRMTKFLLPYKDISQLEWIDNFHLSAVGDNTALVFEYDGGNLEEIAPASKLMVPAMSVNKEMLFSVSHSAVSSRLVIQQSILRNL